MFSGSGFKIGVLRYRPKAYKLRLRFEVSGQDSGCSVYACSETPCNKIVMLLKVQVKSHGCALPRVQKPNATKLLCLM